MLVYVHTRPVIVYVPPALPEYFDGLIRIPRPPQVMTSETPISQLSIMLNNPIGWREVH